MPKILMAAFSAAIFCVSVQAQETSEISSTIADISENTENSADSVSNSENSGSDLFGDLGDLFDNAKDSEETVVTDKQESGSDTTFSLASLSIPLKMSGDISAELGAAAINSDGETSGSAYFDLVNYLYFTTRPDKYMAVKGSLTLKTRTSIFIFTSFILTTSWLTKSISQLEKRRLYGEI